MWRAPLGPVARVSLRIAALEAALQLGGCGHCLLRRLARQRACRARRVMVAMLLAAVLVGIRPALAVAAIPLLIFSSGSGEHRRRPGPSHRSGSSRFRTGPPATQGTASSGGCIRTWASERGLGLSISRPPTTSPGPGPLPRIVVPSPRDQLRRGPSLFVYVFLSSSVATGIVAIATVATGAASRADGFVGDPNIFAVYQLVAVPLAFLLQPTRVVHGSDAAPIRRCSYRLSSSLRRFRVEARSPSAQWPCFSFWSQSPGSTARPGQVAVWSFVLVAATVESPSSRADFRTEYPKGRRRRPGAGHEWRAGMSAFESNPVVGLGLDGFDVDSNELRRTTPGVDLCKFRLAEARHRADTPISSQLQTLASSGSCCSWAPPLDGLRAVQDSCSTEERSDSDEDGRGLDHQLGLVRGGLDLPFDPGVVHLVRAGGLDGGPGRTPETQLPPSPTLSGWQSSSPATTTAPTSPRRSPARAQEPAK